MTLCCLKSIGPRIINRPFPFQFIRYDAFLDAVKTLAATRRCSYYPFDWNTLSASKRRRDIRHTKPVVIERVSALNPVLCDLYSLKIFVESDRSRVLQAALRRGGSAWEREWRELFLPSVDIYMLTLLPIYWFQAEAFAGSVASGPLACQLGP